MTSVSAQPSTCWLWPNGVQMRLTSKNTAHATLKITGLTRLDIMKPAEGGLDQNKILEIQQPNIQSRCLLTAKITNFNQ
jgi:hypothetical protein